MSRASSRCATSSTSGAPSAAQGRNPAAFGFFPRMRGKVRTAEQIIALIASGANGTVGRQELLAAGIAKAQIDRRIENGLLIREYRGVYRVGHRAPSPLASYSAAVNAGGDGAALGDF